MASRTKQKEEARARRLAEERARLERERRQRRMQMLGGVLLAAVAIIAVAIAISSSGGSKATGLQKGPQLAQTKAQVSQLLTGIPQTGATLGRPTAPVTLDYYGDLECPVCKDFTLNGGWRQLVQTDVRAGRVKVVYRAFPTATNDPNTFKSQQVAALAAGKQDRFWNYMELFYHQQGAEGSGYVTQSYLDGIARQIPGLNVSQWQTARNDATLAAQVDSDGAAGQTAGVTGTPTLIAKGPKGSVPVSAATGVPSYGELQKAIKAAA
jgi:protein-disulfide isomerase